MDPIRAVMGRGRIGASDPARAPENGFGLTALFAATFSATHHWLGTRSATTARTAWAPDYPFGMTPEEFAEDMAAVERSWGTRELALEWIPDASRTMSTTRRRPEYRSQPILAFVTLSHPGTSTSFFATDEAGLADLWRECWVGSGEPAGQPS